MTNDGRFCFECRGHDAVLHRGEDGHFRVTCRECGTHRGPFISVRERDEMTEVQSGLGDFA